MFKIDAMVPPYITEVCSVDPRQDELRTVHHVGELGEAVLGALLVVPLESETNGGETQLAGTRC